jgi:hypothetical protein
MVNLPLTTALNMLESGATACFMARAHLHNVMETFMKGNIAMARGTVRVSAKE